MCACGKPTINGEPGAYSWDGKTYSTAKVNPPDLEEGDELLFDGPGRCGSLDSHCYHFRLVRDWKHHDLLILVRHGGGDERIKLSRLQRPGVSSFLQCFESLSDNDRYWLLQMLYETRSEAVRNAEEKNNSMWQRAAAEKRIKSRKNSKQGTVKVWIESPTVMP